MQKLNLDDVTEYVEQNIGQFHMKRINRIEQVKLNDVLKRKNPYLFRAKNILTSESLVRAILDAHLSSNEETLFGNWLEELAIFINSKVYNGYKSSAKGIDLEFEKNNIRYIVAIKSGPNWGNSSQIGKMKIDFDKAKRTLRTSNSNLHVAAVNGCCYGVDNNPDKGSYFKYCGQKFWSFISNEPNLYKDIIEPLGHKAKERNDEFLQKYAECINLFTLEFSQKFCKTNGAIDWDKLVEFNSREQTS